MTQEQKDLLLKDLCARLPYNVWVSYKAKYDDIERATILNGNYVRDIMDGTSSWVDFKPYLRPMSSMTEEEKGEMKPSLAPKGTAMFDKEGIHIPMTHTGDYVPYNFMSKIIDWLLAHHFDFMGLIDEGLAIEVTEENNPYKDKHIIKSKSK